MSLSRYMYYCQWTETLVNTTWYSGGRSTVCPVDRLSENADRIPGSKFDTWHPTNWLGYRIGRSYFSRYRTPTCDLHPSAVAKIGGVDLRAVTRGEIAGFFSSPILHIINVSWAGDSRGRAACNVRSATRGDRPIQTTTKTGGARWIWNFIEHAFCTE